MTTMLHTATVDPDHEPGHHIRLNRFVNMDPAVLRSAVAPVRDQLIPTITDAGARTAFLGVDLENGTGTVITFWGSEQALRSGDRVEAKARAAAAGLSGASLDEGLVDTYRVQRELRVPGVPAPAFARLKHWEGVAPGRIREAFRRVEAEELPALEEMPGFCGLFAAINVLLGNALAVTLWADEASLLDGVEWGDRVSSAIQGIGGSDALTARPLTIDTYHVGMAPQLRNYAAVVRRPTEVTHARAA